ncbi:type III pantothenate kinase [Alcaligenaceae bacterium CGII-47]|nr:type III pantothenate kinase [Alcaligenaceae bacterium CGII-47]
MILLLDAGNTRAKFGWLDPASGTREAQAHALDYSQISELVVWLQKLARRPTRILGVSVAKPTVQHAIEALFIRQYGLQVEWIDNSYGARDLHNSYAQTSQLGTDRWVALLGLLRHVRDQDTWQSGKPMLLASFGTACTLDTLVNLPDQHGTHRPHFVGGLILPGPLLMARSLAEGTARLPYVQGASSDYPTNTPGAISSGIAAAQAGALYRQWRMGLAHFCTAPQVFVSGGGWPLVQAEVQDILARAQADLALPVLPPQYLATPVLDGLASLLSPSG